MSQRSIELRGVTVNNLRHVDLDLPHRQLIVFCGVSGSGKTSMALDTLYAEGQRRYIESFSAYTRQFLEQLDKPAAERIDGIPPAVAVTHKNPSRSNRATVGTTTEVNDYLSLLFARVGEVFCYQCGKPVRRDSPESAAESLASLATGVRLMIGFETVAPKDEPIEQWLALLVELGYVRAAVNEPSPVPSLQGRGNVVAIEPKLVERLAPGDPLMVVLDRLIAGEKAAERLRDSIEAAFAAGAGAAVVLVEIDQEGETVAQQDAVQIDERRWRRIPFSTALRCDKCGIDYPEPEPQLFNFNGRWERARNARDSAILLSPIWIALFLIQIKQFGKARSRRGIRPRTRTS